MKIVVVVVVGFVAAGRWCFVGDYGIQVAIDYKIANFVMCIDQSTCVWFTQKVGKFSGVRMSSYAALGDQILDEGFDVVDRGQKGWRYVF